jgi:LmbE family N-acetylglucosaminyl deacetylase
METQLPIAVERVLAVGAHPDDVEYFAGGTLARLVEAGAAATLVVCSDGGRGGRGLEDAVAVRREEQAAAAAALGVPDVVMMGFPDGELEAARLRARLVAELRRTRPVLVLGHDPRTLWTPAGDRVALGHSDHRASGQALLDAVYPRAVSPNFARGQGLRPWYPREVWLFDSAQPDLLIDVTETWERKAVAGGLMASAHERGRWLGGGERLGEGFIRLRLW